MIDQQLPGGVRWESAEALRAIVDEMVDAVVTIDHRGSILSTNRAVTAMFGYSRDELLGQSVAVLMPEPYRSEHAGYISHYLAGGEARIIGIGRRVEAQCKDGRIFPIKLAVSQVSVGGSFIFTGIIHDISDHVRAQEAEEQLRAVQFHHTELERIAVTGEIAAIMAHEIRTPLNALSINVQMVERLLRRKAEGDIPKAREVLGTLRGEVQRINRLLEDYLHVARKPRGETRERVEMSAIVEDAVHFVGQQAASTQVVVSYDLVSSDPVVWGESAQLRQVILNLLLNAIQAMTEPGEVRVSLTSDGECVVLAVEDNGPGIPKEDLEHIFKPFVSSKEKGTGLGLTVCERIVREMGGRIEARSEGTSGACFEVTLPKAGPCSTPSAIHEESLESLVPVTRD